MRFLRHFPALCAAFFLSASLAAEETAVAQDVLPPPVYPSEKDWGKSDNIPIARAPQVKPASKEELMESFRRAADFLLANQHEDGSWGDHTMTRNTRLACPPPSGPRTFRAASTALCILGLDASPLRDEPRIQEAITRAEDFLLKEMPIIKPANVWIIYNGWAHAYVLEALSARASRLPKDSDRYRQLRDCAEMQVKSLDYLASELGGWGYIYPDKATLRPSALNPTSFMTATVFVAYKSAELVFGLKPDPKVFSNSLKFLKSQRTPAGTYVYSFSHTYYPHGVINRHTGSLARSPVCDLSIKIYEPDFVSIRQLNDHIERLWSRTGWLTMSLKKPKPHESFAKNSGYFVFYGYYYVSLCFEVLPKETLNRHASRLAYDLLPLQEKDGSWWDYPVYNYHKFYGTGYCLFALSKAYDVLYGGAPLRNILTANN